MRATGASLSALKDRLRWTYLPPLLLYFAAGFSGITTLASTFFVKERLALSAEFLAALGFWVGLPWVIKVPVGHLVDVMWRHKGVLVFFGSLTIAASLVIMVGLLDGNRVLLGVAGPGTWYVVSALLAPVGYMLQDTVADALTVDAVRKTDSAGRDLPKDEIARRHSSMQSMGRIAIIAGTILIGIVNIMAFDGLEIASLESKTAAYRNLYAIAFAVPALAVLATVINWRQCRQYGRMLRAAGIGPLDVERIVHGEAEGRKRVQWPILWIGSGFAAVAMLLGLSGAAGSAEIVVCLSLATIVWLLRIILRDLQPGTRRTFLATATVLFVFRAMPTAGAGASWWMIDVLNFDQEFMARLDLWSNVLAIVGLWMFRRFLGRCIGTILVSLCLANCVLALPNIGLFYGLGDWTASHTRGIVDSRFIALADTMVESPLGQLAWIPMLAWIANSAPADAKAAYFALMSSFFNLARSCSHIATKYLNSFFTVTREVVDGASGVTVVSQNYSEMGKLMIVTVAVATAIPLLALLILKPASIQADG